MGPDGLDASGVEHNDLVRIADSGESVSNYKSRSPLDQARECILYERFLLPILSGQLFTGWKDAVRLRPGTQVGNQENTARCGGASKSSPAYRGALWQRDQVVDPQR